eukprot:8462205-Pyramimonas_sp.AAC.1
MDDFAREGRRPEAALAPHACCLPARGPSSHRGASHPRACCSQWLLLPSLVPPPPSAAHDAARAA